MTTQKSTPIKALKSKLSKRDLNFFKKLLLNKRAAAKKELDALEENIENMTDSDDADYSSLTHHLGDIGSDVEEKNLTYQLLERTSKYIKEIDAALVRIENGTYGICRLTGKMISRKRLEAVPHTRYSIEAKTRA